MSVRSRLAWQSRANVLRRSYAGGIDHVLLGLPGWRPPVGLDARDGYPVLRGLRIWAQHRWAGAGDQPGGDLYEVVVLADQTPLIVLGDASGSGPGAAAIASLVVRALRSEAPTSTTPSELLEKLNKAVLDANTERYCTVVVVALDGEQEVSVVTAGHGAPRLVASDGSVREVGRPGMPIGMFDEVSFGIDRTAVESGDTLVLFTDGVTEARAPLGVFQPGLLNDILYQQRNKSLPELVSAVIRRAESLQAGVPLDDIAVLALRWVPGP